MNEYANLTEIPYVSLFVQPNVSLLYNIAKDAYEEREKARTEVNNLLKEWGKFHSLSNVDMQNYYNQTIAPMQLLIAQGAANPELMKSAAYRNALLNQINNVDYRSLAAMEKNAENFDNRAKIIAEMKAKGLYADWMDDPRMTTKGLTKWNTSKDGIMSDFSPIQYKDLRALGLPYVEKLKPKFYKGQDPITGTKKLFTDWSAITGNDIKSALAQSIDDIKATPQGDKWYKRIAEFAKKQDPNISDAQIDNLFIDQLAQKQADKIGSTPITDLVGLSMWSANKAAESRIAAARIAANKGKNGKSDDPGKLGFTTVSKIKISDNLKQRFQKALAQNGGIVAHSNKRMLEIGQDLLQRYDEILKREPDSEFSKAFKEVCDKMLKDPSLKNLSAEEATDYRVKQAIMLTQMANRSGVNVANDAGLRGSLQTELDKYTKLSQLAAETVPQYALAKMYGEAAADKLDHKGNSGNAFSRFEINPAKGGNLIVKDNSLKKITDTIFGEVYTPLTGTLRQTVEKGPMSVYIGKPLPDGASSPAQALEMLDGYNQYMREGMRKNAHRYYKHYGGTDVLDKVRQATLMPASNATYERNKWAPWASDKAQDVNLEKLAAQHKIPTPTVKEVVGMMDFDTGDRGYVVKCEIPYDDLAKEGTGLGVRFWPDGGLEDTLTDYGYEIYADNSGEKTKKYVRFNMVVPVAGSDTDSWYNDISAAKVSGEPSTQIGNTIDTNNLLLQQLGALPGDGWGD